MKLVPHKNYKNTQNEASIEKILRRHKNFAESGEEVVKSFCELLQAEVIALGC